MTKLQKSLKEHVDAGFAGIWIHSQEPHEAMREVVELAGTTDGKWLVPCWDCANGFNDRLSAKSAGDGAGDPTPSLNAFHSLGGTDNTVLFVLFNLHKFLHAPDVMQTVYNKIIEGRKCQRFICVIAPTSEIPVELQKVFVVIRHQLPSMDELRAVALGLGARQETLTDATLEAALGLTRSEAEDAFSLSLLRNNKFDPSTVWEIKSGMLQKDGLLELYQGDASFERLGGLSHLKDFCAQSIQNRSDKAKPKGVLLVSPPGCGKSEFAKALGNYVGLPTIVFDPGALMASHVGESEGNMRRALDTVDAMAPCVLFIDEVEKALSGVQSSGETDSGVTARMFGSFLTWLNDHESSVYVVMTSNDISKLPPEFSRAERFDAIFFIDFPDAETRKRIWDIYFDQYGLDHQQNKPEDNEWTGAEIKACCRLAAIRGKSVVQSAQTIVPVAKSVEGRVDALRKHAQGRWVSADYEGIYTVPTKTAKRRSLNLDN